MRLKKCFQTLAISCMAFLPLNAFASDELITGRGLPETYTEVTAQKTTSGSTLIFLTARKWFTETAFYTVIP